MASPFGFGQYAAGDDQNGDLAKLGNRSQIGENVESRAPVGQTHVEHGSDHRRRSQQLDGGVNRFRLDAAVPRSLEKAPRCVPDERFIVEDEDGRKCGFLLRIRVHVAAYLKLHRSGATNS